MRRLSLQSVVRDLPPRREVDTELIQRIIEFVDNYVTTTKRFPSSQEISRKMKVEKAKCRRHIDLAISSGKISCVFSSSEPMRPKVLAPTRMVESMTQVPELPPSWVEGHSIASKAKAVENQERANRAVSTYTDLEALLWRIHRPLALACCNLLREMRFNVEYKEEAGDHDLEISDGDYFAIAEVTGSENQIKIANADSLSRYYMKLKYESGKKAIVALLIGNAFHRDDLPRRRLAPFSNTLVKAVQKEYSYISLISTVDLYHAIGRVLDEIDTREQFRESFKSGALYYRPHEGA